MRDFHEVRHSKIYGSPAVHEAASENAEGVSQGARRSQGKVVEQACDKFSVAAGQAMWQQDRERANRQDCA